MPAQVIETKSPMFGHELAIEVDSGSSRHYARQSDDHIKRSKVGTSVPGGNMKKLGVSTALAVLTFSFLSWLSPLNAHADSVTMKFTAVGGTNSGGVFTYPYDFTVTPTGGGASQNLSLMCIDFNTEVYISESWTANVYTASTAVAYDGTGNDHLTLTTAQFEEDAYLYTQAESNPTMSGAANWADWALEESNTLPGQKSFLQSYIGTGTEYTDAVNYLNFSSVDLAEYANYLIYVPTTDGHSGDTDDKTPQTFVGAPAPTPEPSSLVLLGSGLLAAAGALYRRKKQLTA
jgi:hypothetical protein